MAVTSIDLGEHFSDFISVLKETGRYRNTSEAVRAGLRLLELEEQKLLLLRQTLAKGEAQLDQGEGIAGDDFMDDLINR